MSLANFIHVGFLPLVVLVLWYLPDWIVKCVNAYLYVRRAFGGG